MKQCKTSGSEPFRFAVEKENVGLILLLREEVMSAQGVFTLKWNVGKIEDVGMSTHCRISYPREWYSQFHNFYTSQREIGFPTHDYERR